MCVGSLSSIHSKIHPVTFRCLSLRVFDLRDPHRCCPDGGDDGCRYRSKPRGSLPSALAHRCAWLYSKVCECTQ